MTRPQVCTKDRNPCFLNVCSVLIRILHIQGTAWPWDPGRQSKRPAIEGLLYYAARLPNLFSHTVNILPALDRLSGDVPNLPYMEASFPHFRIYNPTQPLRRRCVLGAGREMVFTCDSKNISVQRHGQSPPMTFCSPLVLLISRGCSHNVQ